MLVKQNVKRFNHTPEEYISIGGSVEVIHSDLKEFWETHKDDNIWIHEEPGPIISKNEFVFKMNIAIFENGTFPQFNFWSLVYNGKKGTIFI